MRTFSALIALCLAADCSAEKPHILFIAIDDLRPELGCYGSPAVKSPHLDAIAASGLRFDRAYCQQAICSPSRASLLTGTRPDTNGLTHNYIDFSEVDQSLTTLPKHFANNGYETVTCGKIFHRKDHSLDSWTRQPNRKLLNLPKPKHYALPENQKLRNENFKKMFEKYGEAAKRGLGSGPAYENADVPDHTYVDGYNTELAIATLKGMTGETSGMPIIMAMGYKLPHLNWIAPKKYLGHVPDRDKIQLATQTEGPKDGAAMGLHASFELRTRAGIPKFGPLGDDLSRTLLHAYYASVSYVDAQIGKLVATLKETGIYDNTIIIVWGDHGWHLGEMGIWGKATNYEIAARVPMMVSAPGMKARGKGSNALVELLDIYPTLCDLTGLPKPDHIEGKSFAALLDDARLPHHEGALTQFPNPALREWAAYPLSKEMRQTFFGPLIEQVEERIKKQQGDKWDRELFEKHLTGYTLRTDRYRFVAWRDHRSAGSEPLFVELFDHQHDPTETVNVAKANPEVVKALTKQLHETLNR